MPGNKSGGLKEKSHPPYPRDGNPHARKVLDALAKYPGVRPASEGAQERFAIELACDEERENILSSVVAVAESAQQLTGQAAKLQVLALCLVARALLLRERTGQ